MFIFVRATCTVFVNESFVVFICNSRARTEVPFMCCCVFVGRSRPEMESLLSEFLVLHPNIYLFINVGGEAIFELSFLFLFKDQHQSNL